jgi:transcriptional regulator with XRE-family HTH domain
MKKRKRAGPTPFSKILRALMTEKSVSVRKAAELAGVGTSTVDNWRGGALPEDYSAVKRLARGLGVSFSFLLTGEEDERANGQTPAISEVFDDGGPLFDGYAKILIQRLIPRRKSGG